MTIKKDGEILLDMLQAKSDPNWLAKKMHKTSFATKKHRSGIDYAPKEVKPETNV